MNIILPDEEVPRDRILREIADGEDLPAVGAAVAQVVRLASSEDDSVRELASFLLSDVALTQKILRMSNTVGYRTMGGLPVTTISRAIFLLGFEAIKTSALAMMLVDGMQGRRGRAVRNELSFALAASVIGRELARRSTYKEAEEAAIAALFKNFGRVLVAAHDHVLYDRIALLVERENLTPVQASLKLLGCSFEALGEVIMRDWGIPESIVHATSTLSAGPLKPPRNRGEWMQQVASFSNTLAAMMPRITDPGRDGESKMLLARYGAALGLDEARLAEIVTLVETETQALTRNSDIAFIEDDDEPAAESEAGDQAQPVAEVPDPLAKFAMATMPVKTSDRHPSGKPLQSQQMLLTGIQELTQMATSGKAKINDVMMLALETLYGGMGFRYATVCMREVKTNVFKSRIALGSATPKLPKNFAFAVTGSGASKQNDLFYHALGTNTDILVADASSTQIAKLLPAWHKAMLPETRSFILLPLVVSEVPIGYIYADRAVTAPEGIPPEEAMLIKMVKSQILATLTVR